MLSDTHGCSPSLVFSIPELVALIAEHVPRETAAKIASTCKSIYHAASVRIWESLDRDGLQRLADVLVDDGWYTDDGYGSIEARWARLAYYSAMVRNLNVVFLLGDDTLLETLQSVSAMLPTGSWLLPNLSTLYFACTFQEFDVASLLLCPSLSKVTIEISFGGNQILSIQEQLHMASFLHKLANIATHLTDFGIHGIWRIVPAFTPALRKIVALPLRAFQSGPLLEASVLAELAQSPTLTKLVLCGDLPYDLEHFPTALALSAHDGSPPRLSTIQLIMSVTTAFALLRGLRGPLETLVLDLSPPSAPRLDPIFSDIVYVSKTLRSVDLALNPGDGPVRWTSFQPFETCQLMKSFHMSLSSDGPFELGDEHIASMAKAWPELERLKIEWYTSYMTHKATKGLLYPFRLTLNGLLVLAQHCPEVVELRLTFFDASGDIHRPPENLQRRRMRFIRAHRADIRTSDDVALFLSLCWPSVQVVTHRQQDKWTRVNDSVRLLGLYGRLLDSPNSDDPASISDMIS